ncbi:hypothetical protein CHGG_01973 [Chaetomium globosum CBS 148.51]|uniref:Uncharacterized protein n=1 Tax=Chaetomium globosum (strain ATCC 6205 / CBS 148.51 / DSM 1962 / NBRC 6347 / NRRL 1970) TaxID=306901 RepID=Q2HCT1_CHAGB|nr:uncharacterized protein CHGG_01973 [Chaetomium globosum CBS 148.51]EAQ93738.1 hypothetical protein CHGG_01973 [Chaetomium globosum CBS 148.51]
MGLDSPVHMQALHTRGKSTISSFTGGKKLPYVLAEAKSEQPVIPSPDLFSDFPDHKATGFRLPTISECAAHLELLETFYVLRQRILRSQKIDGAMGIVPERETKTGVNYDKKTLKDPKLWEKRQKKWPAFVEFAVIRFLVWRRTLQTLQERQPGETGGTTREFYLPPVDVLMVWHALMLNPLLFFKHFHGKPLYNMAMPWRKVAELIDSNAWVLTLPETASAKFESDTALSTDLFAFLERWPPVPDLNTGTDSTKPNNERPLAVPVPRATAMKLAVDANAPAADPQFTIEGHPEIQKYFDEFKRASETDLAAQLRDAVIRQTSFIDKMNNRLWIRSPFVSSTLRRGIGRYEKFLELMRVYPGRMFVPTLDIDLAWHTHQCQGSLYAKGTIKMGVRVLGL